MSYVSFCNALMINHPTFGFHFVHNLSSRELNIMTVFGSTTISIVYRFSNELCEFWLCMSYTRSSWFHFIHNQFSLTTLLCSHLCSVWRSHFSMVYQFSTCAIRLVGSISFTSKSDLSIFVSSSIQGFEATLYP